MNAYITLKKIDDILFPLDALGGWDPDLMALTGEISRPKNHAGKTGIALSDVDICNIVLDAMSLSAESAQRHAVKLQRWQQGQ